MADGGTRELFKAGSGVLKQEPFNEVVASLLYARLLNPDEYVAYRVERHGYGYYSVCPCFVDERHEFVTVRDLYWSAPSSVGSPTYTSLVGVARRLGVPNMDGHLDRLICLDYVLGNVDRHLSNFGVMRTQADGAFERIAPIFDSGLSLLCLDGDHDQDALAVHANPFLRRQSEQLSLVQDLSWFDAGALRGFADEAVEILAACPSRYMDQERLTFLHAFIDAGIRVVAEIAQIPAVSPDDIVSIGKRADLIDEMRTRFMRDGGPGTYLRV